MVLANVKIFPFAYITRDTYAQVQEKLKQVLHSACSQEHNELEKNTNSEISFNFKDQFFSIKARSQCSCDNIESLLSNRLLPRLNAIIKKDNYICGTIPSLDYNIGDKDTYRDTPASSSLKNGEKSDAIDGASEDAAEVSSDDEDGDDYDSDDSADSFERSLPKASRRKDSLKAHSNKKDAKSALLKKKKNEFLEKFILAKNIRNPDDILFGPPMLTMAAADYLVVVGQQTGTECTLNGREIHIFGPSAEAVKEAQSRFMAIQTLHKRCRRKPTVMPCLHLNGDRGDYGVYFCPLDRYSKQDSVAIIEHNTPSWVLVPAFKNANGKYMKPSDIVDDKDLADQMNELNARFNRVSPAQSRSRTPPQVGSPSAPTSSWGPSPSTPPAWGPSSSAGAQHNLPERTSAPPGQTPLWGENRYIISVSSKSSGKAKSPDNRSRSSRPSTPGSSTWGPPPSAAEEEVKDFPALPTSPTKEPNKRGGKQQRRVLNIRPQKAPSQLSKDPAVSRLAIARDYNLNNIKEALKEGLNSIRTFRGEIKLSAKLGKVLWNDIPETVQRKIWGFYDVKDVLVKEQNIEPVFNSVAIVSEHMLKGVLSCLPSKSSARSVYYEIHNDFRTKASETWKQATMYVAATSAKMYKLHLLQQSIAEVDWISLDRKFDFQLQLKVSEIGRAEVKPFMSFSRRMALRPNPDGAPGSQLVFEETPGLIKVNRILYKEARSYTLGNGFELHVIRVEDVPRTKDYESSSNIKYTAQSGRNRVWYEIEVTFQSFQDTFEVNIEKEQVGVPESWTPEDVFGKDDNLLQRFILTMINTLNRFEEY